MSRKHPEGEKSFDGMAPRFARNIYNSAKGRLRLAVLERDFEQHMPLISAETLDIGGGQGQWALALAKRGHHVLLSDISPEMIELAKLQVQGSTDLKGSLTFRSASLQSHYEEGKPFELVNCHAVLEWLPDPKAGLAQCVALTQSQGYLSVIFYNVHGLIMKNLLRTNYQKVLEEDYRGYKGSLTPPNPLEPEVVCQWAKDLELELVCMSGIRTFHDYILDPVAREKDFETVKCLELQYSQREPYRHLGRYIHCLWRKA